jgi:predicted nucleic-acid-binding protein
MDERSAGTSEDLALRGLRYTKEQFDDVLGQTEEYVRENPGQALLYALVAGYILNRLPVGRMVGTLLRLSFFALKPAILIYGATKLYKAAQEN